MLSLLYNLSEEQYVEWTNTYLFKSKKCYLIKDIKENKVYAKCTL